MTQLFVRFYLGVLLVLFTAWWIQSYLQRRTAEASNARVAEAALGGGTRLGGGWVDDARDATEQEWRLGIVQELFEYPVRIIPGDQIPLEARTRFANGEVAVLIGRNVDGDDLGFMLAPLDEGSKALQFGPLPQFAEPSQIQLFSGLGLVLLLAAGSIALLLRPVARQLRQLERTAVTIADGDLTARVDERRMKAARPLAKAFNHMAGKTETLLRTQKELLQAVSHELRTPLSRIHFGIDLIRDAEDSTQLQERLDSLESATGELDGLVGELISYVRMESDAVQPEMKKVSLRPLLENIVAIQAPLFPEIDFEIDDSISANEFTLLCDESGIDRALSNLVRNAGRFAKGRVRVSAICNDEGIDILVDDDGPGIPEEDRSRVFSPFVRLKDSGRGVGLGLSLVQRIVSNHGGTVCVKSSPLGGCRIQSRWNVSMVIENDRS